jgi:tetratricopeptide (TPR) repeat protein
MGSKAMLSALAAVSALLLLGSGAHAAVSVLGGGLAHDCSLAARDGRADTAAVELCTLALESEPMGPRERAGTFVNRGVIKLRMRNWASAKSDFDYAIRADAQLGEAYVNRGAAQIALKHYPESLADLDRGIALGSEEPEKAWYNRGLVHEKLDDMKSAYFDYRKALELKPGWDMPQKELQRFTVTEVGG